MDWTLVWFFRCIFLVFPLNYSNLLALTGDWLPLKNIRTILYHSQGSLNFPCFWPCHSPNCPASMEKDRCHYWNIKPSPPSLFSTSYPIASITKALHDYTNSRYLMSKGMVLLKILPLFLSPFHNLPTFVSHSLGPTSIMHIDFSRGFSFFISAYPPL